MLACFAQQDLSTDAKDVSPLTQGAQLGACVEDIEHGRIMKQIITLIMSISVFLSGCATSQTLSEQDTKNKIYSGTIRNWELKCAHATCLDFPFSIVADTLVLPYTIPKTVINYCCSDAGNTQNEMKSE